VRILKGFKCRVLEVRILKKLEARFSEVRILKSLEEKTRRERNCGAEAQTHNEDKKGLRRKERPGEGASDGMECDESMVYGRIITY
jgi:hypothetical protein